MKIIIHFCNKHDKVYICFSPNLATVSMVSVFFCINSQLKPKRNFVSLLIQVSGVINIIPSYPVKKYIIIGKRDMTDHHIEDVFKFKLC